MKRLCSDAGFRNDINDDGIYTEVKQKSYSYRQPDGWDYTVTAGDVICVKAVAQPGNGSSSRSFHIADD